MAARPQPLADFQHRLVAKHLRFVEVLASAVLTPPVRSWVRSSLGTANRHEEAVGGDLGDIADLVGRHADYNYNAGGLRAAGVFIDSLRAGQLSHPLWGRRGSGLSPAHRGGLTRAARRLIGGGGRRLLGKALPVEVVVVVSIGLCVIAVGSVVTGVGLGAGAAIGLRSLGPTFRFDGLFLATVVACGRDALAGWGCRPPPP